MPSVLRKVTYRRLFVAHLLALVGSGLATVALALLAYDIAGADAGTVLGLAFAIKMVAYVLAPLFSTVLARFSARRVLVTADVVRCAAAVSLPFVDQVWQIYALIFVLQAASAAFMPTFQAVIPLVLTASDDADDDYAQALSLARVSFDLEAVLAPALAAAALLVIESNVLFAGTAVGFAASAAIVVRLRLPQPKGAPPARLIPALRLFTVSGPLRALVPLHLCVAAAGAFVLVQTPVIVRDALALGETPAALALGAYGVGSIAAAVVLPRLLRRWSERRVMLPATVLVVAPVLVFPLVLELPPVLGWALVCALWVILGVGWSFVETPVGRLVRATVEPADLRGAFATQFSLSHLCWLVTYPAAGWLGASGHLTRASWVLGSVSVLAAATAALLWRRRTRTTSGHRPQTTDSANWHSSPGSV